MPHKFAGLFLIQILHKIAPIKVQFLHICAAQKSLKRLCQISVLHNCWRREKVDKVGSCEGKDDISDQNQDDFLEQGDFCLVNPRGLDPHHSSTLDNEGAPPLHLSRLLSSFNVRSSTFFLYPAPDQSWLLRMEVAVSEIFYSKL